ncbi:Tyrosine phosphatase family protein [Cognatiyoonia koreensis]|uniref:Tyrosine phosphatase family protein n=1 Tax=Cognatiyoonia koreensis TaxID=364200 RepID=A0A1I0QG02_9RHOB|nr:tyrosine-protein phosphatase [Cognatiyoonia koreensis]SEW25891.1 Tyrosine phosphatase family protein [Cognatiyoonia koreensis]
MSPKPQTDIADRKASYGRDITDPTERRRSRWYVLFSDHGILRTFWTNFGQVAEGVYRSNHPGHTRLETYKKNGIKAVLNLRGKGKRAPYLFEEESCAALGLDLISIPLHARQPAKRDHILNLFSAFDTIQRPFVMHCKSGADRAGLASALYLLDQGAPVSEARKELSLRYFHLRFTKTGVQDHMLDLFEQRQAEGQIGIRDWIANEYDPAVLEASFAKKKILPV